MKKSMGETVFRALTPPHPAVLNASTASKPHIQRKFQINLTCEV